MTSSQNPLIHIIRHGEALHNVHRSYPHHDPPLTDAGDKATKCIKLTSTPDLILISPFTRTLQTALNIFPFLQVPSASPIPVQIWSDLREAHDAPCNIGLPRSKLQDKFPQFDFSDCREEWDYAPHTSENATARAERVRFRLKALSAQFDHIAVITHRGFIAFLAKGKRFDVCERRTFKWATEQEEKERVVRWGTNCDSLEEQDFGPTVLVLHKRKEEWEFARDTF